MVLEDLISPIKAKKKPWEMFFIGMIYSSVGVLLSLFIFEKDSGLVMVFFTVLASAHIIHSFIKSEEKINLTELAANSIVKKHSKVLYSFMLLFFGFVVSFALWNIFLPPGIATSAFSTQVSVITRVESAYGGVTGGVIGDFSRVSFIFFNNFRVLVFCILFAFFYGIGAIFILTWNASVIGVAVGNFVRNTVGGSYFSTIPLGVLRYSIHGIPEILAYFMAGLAGGIISVAIIRHDFGDYKFKRVLKDSLGLIAGSVLVLTVAALLEVFVTPIFF